MFKAMTAVDRVKAFSWQKVSNALSVAMFFVKRLCARANKVTSAANIEYLTFEVLC